MPEPGAERTAHNHAGLEDAGAVSLIFLPADGIYTTTQMLELNCASMQFLCFDFHNSDSTFSRFNSQI